VFRIKICGITTPEDALLVGQSGADAVGLNFYPKSPRYLSVDRARAVVEAIPVGVVKVGLFVNDSPDDACRLFDELGLDLIQLHGDESPEQLSKLGGRPVMKAFRVGVAGLTPVLAYLDQCRKLSCLPRLVLLDSQAPGVFGGSGQLGDWRLLASYPQEPDYPDLILAGGLTPVNVGDAIRVVRPKGVDTASGVELAPGRKSPELVRAFVARVQEAWM
jgi:phosphoribosylanthranilate isomerase